MIATAAAIGLLSGCSSPKEIPLELKLSLHTAAPEVIVVTFTDQYRPEALPQNPLETTAEAWSIDDNAPKALYRSSRAADELPRTADGRYPVLVEYRIYLLLDTPLQSGRTYTVTGPFGSTEWRFDEAAVRCESIKVNQVGYHPDSPVRYANLGVFMGDGGSIAFDTLPAYRVIAPASGREVHSGTAVYLGDDTAVGKGAVTSGEHVYRLDLSAVPPGGPYHILVDGFGISHPFSITREAVEEIASVYTRGLYHQRCGIALEAEHTPFTRDICHTSAADTRTPWSPSGRIIAAPSDPVFAVTGGWHDAGDFDRRPQHTIVPILLLTYFEAFPDHFHDGQFNLPESGNGLPDFLDEALWGVRLWESLQITDPSDPHFGGIRAGTETDGHPEYGRTDAASDPHRYGTWEVSPEVTAFGAGMMAQAARLLAARPGFHDRARRLFHQAMLAWRYLGSIRLENGSPYHERDCAAILYAALQLHLAADHHLFRPLSDKTDFPAIFARTAQALLIEDGFWPQQYRPGNSYAAIQTAHFASYLLGDNPADPRLAAALRQVIFRQAEKGGYMGFSEAAAFYPQGATKGYGWGAATAQGRYADVYAFAYRLTTDPEQKHRLLGVLSQFGDYALGLNPLGVSFVTGLGASPPNSPLHLDSWFTKSGTGTHSGNPIGNVPGILIFGPTEGRSRQPYQLAVSDTVYPVWEDLPLQRRWADGWSLVDSSEFSVWETMVWNICLYGVLNHFGSGTASEADSERSAAE